MPVYLHIFNLIINKKAVTDKYFGGLEQFRKDYDIPESEINQEDGQLFSLGAMNADQFDIESLIMNGLSFDKENQCSDDFTIIYRNENIYWEVDWLKNNGVFAWHVNAHSKELEKVSEISTITMDTIIDLMKKGDNPLKTIRIDNK